MSHKKQAYFEHPIVILLFILVLRGIQGSSGRLSRKALEDFGYTVFCEKQTLVSGGRIILPRY